MTNVHRMMRIPLLAVLGAAAALVRLSNFDAVPDDEDDDDWDED